MMKGSCLCGAVKYECEGPLTFMARCHCVQCRKASGAEFATNAFVPAETFRVVAGEARLRQYESSPGNFRVFCGDCGSPLFKRGVDRPAVVRIRLGCLDTEMDQRPLAHIYVSQRPKWSEIHDDVPQHDRLPR